MKSVPAIFLDVLGLVPTGNKYHKYKTIIQSISISRLCDKLAKHRFSARSDRELLIKSLKLHPDDEQSLITGLPEYKNTLWNNLKFCGSGITPDMFEEISMDGDISSDHKLLSDTYSQEFLEHFEYLWLRDKALRKIEWKLLYVGSLTNRLPLLFYMPEDIANHILHPDTTLIDVIALRSSEWSLSIQNMFTMCIGQAIIYKIKSDISKDLYQHLKKWLFLDPIHATVILENSLDKDNSCDVFKLTERFENRIRSDKGLTREFKYFIKPMDV